MINPLLILTSTVVTLSNPKIKNGSTIENKPYHDYKTLPEAVILRNNWKIFREETLNSYKNYSTILASSASAFATSALTSSAAFARLSAVMS